jgi:nicotinate-nucleotide adenylyltransferase
VSVEFAVFGGSFDPPHVSHTLLACYALNAHALERVLVVPTHVHAFAKQLAPFEDRIRMCELAFAPLTQVEICSIERELPGPNRTLDTLRALQQRYPHVRLRLLIGSDILADTHAWHDFAAVQRLAAPLVIQRQGLASTDPEQPALPAVSSTEIRRRLQQGEATEGWLSPAVEQYVRSRGLYRP